MGYLPRILAAFEEDGVKSSRPPEKIRQWLVEAAIQGHQAAFEDITNSESGGLTAKEIRSLKASRYYGCPYSAEDVRLFKQQVQTLSHNDVQNLRFGSDERSLLHWAAELDLTGHINVLLDEFNMDINCRDVLGQTPMIAACRAGQLKSTLLLLSAGADVNAKTLLRETALHFIWRFCDSDALKSYLS
ncbi:ankyrin repeat-containing domain protein [Aspergillus heterothallicus]